MANKKARWLVGLAGGLWGLCVGLLAVVLLTAFSGTSTIIVLIFILALPFGVIGGTVLGARGASRLLPFLRPVSFTNRALLRTAGFAIGLPALLIAGFYVPFNPWVQPSDADLVAQFNKNESAFSRLVQMNRQDSRLETMSRSGMFSDEPKEADQTPARIAEYRTLLHRVSVWNVSTKSDGAIQFPIWRFGGGTASLHIKGLAYLPKPPAKTYASLDGRPRAALMYRPVKGNWYLYWRFVE